MNTTLAIDPLSLDVSPRTDLPLSCAVITDFAEWERLAPEWTRLWKSDPEAEVFQTFAWNRAWWLANAHHFELCTVVVWSGKRVTAILPLVKRGSTIQFMATPEADYADILCEEKDATRGITIAIQALFGIKGWDECVLMHLSCNSRVVRHWKELPSRIRDRCAMVAAAPCPTILLRTEPGLLKKLADKKHLRRHETKLQKSAPLVLRLLSGGEDITRRLPDFIRQQILRRELSAEASSCQRPEFTALLYALAEQTDLFPQMKFFVLEWNGQPLAYHLGFEVNGKFTMYQQTFNVDAWDYSAGEVLMRQLFLYAHGRVTREFDFSVGEEFYKSRFANHYKPNFVAYIENRSIWGKARSLRRKIQGSLAQPISKLKLALRSWSRIYRAAKYLRVWCAETEALLRHVTDETPLGQAADGTKIEIKQALLGDLAELHRECPRFRLATKLGTFKQRLRDGDKVYIGRHQGRPALLAWVRKSSAQTSTADRKEIYDWVPLQKKHWQVSREAVHAFLATLK